MNYKVTMKCSALSAKPEQTSFTLVNWHCVRLSVRLFHAYIARRGTAVTATAHRTQFASMTRARTIVIHKPLNRSSLKSAKYAYVTDA